MLDDTTIATLKREKAALEETMKTGRARIKALDSLLKAYDVSKPAAKIQTQRQKAAPTQPKAESRVSLRDHIRDILSDGRSMAARDIRTTLQTRRIDFTDNNLSYTLSSSPLFENADGKWSLTVFDGE